MTLPAPNPAWADLLDALTLQRGYTATVVTLGTTALGIAGGLVTVHGGPMSHAAVLSRELGLPAVIGVEDCLEHIQSGDRVEVDPAKGLVTVLS